jgi:nitrite reductase/ring-hydroxylating ferredoxin subunit
VLVQFTCTLHNKKIIDIREYEQPEFKVEQHFIFFPNHAGGVTTIAKQVHAYSNKCTGAFAQK